MPYQPTEKDNYVPPPSRSLVAQLTWKDYLTIASILVGLVAGVWKGMTYLFYPATDAAVHVTKTTQSFKVLVEDYKGLKRRVRRLSKRVQQLEIQNAVLHERSKTPAAGPVIRTPMVGVIPGTVYAAPPVESVGKVSGDKTSEDKSLDLPILRKKR